MTDKILPIFDENGLQKKGKEVGQHLKRMRTRAGYTQEAVTNDEMNSKHGFPGLSTYKTMESGDVKSSFAFYLQMFHLFHGTDRDAAILFGNRESEPFVDTSHDNSPAHIARLKKFTYQNYTVIFVNEMDEPKLMNLCFGNIINSSYVQGNAKIGRKYTYDCKLVSPVNSPYVFIYFTSTTSLVDRAFFVLPEIEWITGRFKRGVGLMISISTDQQRCPTSQLFVMIHKIYKMPEFDEIKKHLVLKNSQMSTYMMRLQDLKSRNIRFNDSVVLERKTRNKPLSEKKSNNAQP